MAATITKKPGQKQSLPFKRANSFQADPKDLYLETTPGKRFYSARSVMPYDEVHVVGMLSHGVEKAVLVCVVDQKAVVIDGRRRIVNAREANRRREVEGLAPILVLVKVVKGNELRLLEKTILTNAHRKQNDPVEEAELMQQQRDLGVEPESIAAFWGYGERTVLDRLKLLDLAPGVIAAVRHERLAAQKALKWHGLSWAEQRKALKGAPGKGVRAKAVRRPTRKKLDAVRAHGAVPIAIKAVLKWVAGEITDLEAMDQVPGLLDALGDPGLATALDGKSKSMSPPPKPKRGDPCPKCAGRLACPPTSGCHGSRVVVGKAKAGKKKKAKA